MYAWRLRSIFDSIFRSRAIKASERVSNYDPPRGFSIAAARERASVKPESVEALFWAHEGRLAHKWPHYFEIYDRLFEKFRQGFPGPDGAARPLRFLEIGVSQGGSLQLWRRFFGPEAIIFGVDVDPRCAAVDDADLKVRIGSQADPVFMRAVIAEMGGVDIILDDGSHVAEHQRASLDVLFPLLSEGGLYVVEDVQTAYWRRWQGGYRRPGTFIEVAKTMIDDMYARYHAFGAGRAFASEEIFSTCFYDGVVAFEKRKRSESFHIRVGKPTF